MWRWLFDTSLGPPGPDTAWPVWFSLVFHGGNLVGAAALLAYVVVILRAWRFRRDGFTARQMFDVAAFLLAVALCRLARVACLLGPLNNLTAVCDLNAAAWTVYSLYHLRPVVTHVLMLRSRAAFHDVLDRLNEESLARQEEQAFNRVLIVDLTTKLKNAHHRLKTAEWTGEQAAALKDLEEILRRVDDHGK